MSGRFRNRQTVSTAWPDGCLAYGNTASAIKALERPLALDPQNAYAAGKLQKLRQGR